MNIYILFKYFFNDFNKASHFISVWLLPIFVTKVIQHVKHFLCNPQRLRCKSLKTVTIVV